MVRRGTVRALGCASSPQRFHVAKAPLLAGCAKYAQGTDRCRSCALRTCPDGAPCEEIRHRACRHTRRRTRTHVGARARHSRARMCRCFRSGARKRRTVLGWPARAARGAGGAPCKARSRQAWCQSCSRTSRHDRAARCECNGQGWVGTGCLLSHVQVCTAGERSWRGPGAHMCAWSRETQAAVHAQGARSLGRRVPSSRGRGRAQRPPLPLPPHARHAGWGRPARAVLGPANGGRRPRHGVCHSEPANVHARA